MFVPSDSGARVAPHTQAPRSGCMAMGWIALTIVAVVLGLFGYKVWHYARGIRSGTEVRLPQYLSQFTAAGGAVAADAVAAAGVTLAPTTAVSLGNEQAGLTIVEFADFSCPYSKAVSPSVRRLMLKEGVDVRFVFRDFPVVALHPDAPAAAAAARCANEQGKFWPYHDKLFGTTPPFSTAQLLQFGREVGLDEGQFERCVTSNRYADAVAADVAAAQTLGLRGTPTFFFNGQKVEGAIPDAVLTQIVDRLKTP
jgi:protein-disulfide isomerase